ncbi:MAG: fibrobacter succinogenes major paralogous domain-containing protein [Prevotellaceae bacterium]|nr:fibrobacter succinogenes major paralogous domain-containing protein [Prevotellaceae bacterium]
MKQLKKLFLLLIAGITVQDAWAQNQMTAQPGKDYKIESSADATGISGTPKYQWYRDGQIIPGATSASYTIPAEKAIGKSVEFKRAAFVDNCDERKFSNTLTISFCRLITPNGVCWADRNVGQPGTFAEKPDMFTPYYQWNRPNKAWGVSEVTVEDWQATADQADTWTAGTPCPTGWRLPIKDEFMELDSLGGQLIGGPNGTRGGQWRTVEAGYGNTVKGRFYGPNTATCTFNNMEGCVFFPAVGRRSNTDGARLYQNQDGYYWSNTPASQTNGYNVFFHSTYNNATNSYNKAIGLPIRCVLDEK